MISTCAIYSSTKAIPSAAVNKALITLPLEYLNRHPPNAGKLPINL